MDESNQNEECPEHGNKYDSAHCLMCNRIMRKLGNGATPRPWFMAESNGVGELPKGTLVIAGLPEYRQPGLEHNGNIICAIAPAHRVTAQDRANAELIVAAVNQYALPSSSSPSVTSVKAKANPLGSETLRTQTEATSKD